MKNKFVTQENGSMLGATIQQVRKAKKITQEELGKRTHINIITGFIDRLT